MNIKTLIAALAMSICLSGCFTASEPVVEATKQWEGRYTSLEEASKALQDAAAAGTESQVWLLQPSTLSRLLRNVEK